MCHRFRWTVCSTPVALLGSALLTIVHLPIAFGQNGGRFAVAGTPVMWPLTYAFRLKDYQIVAAPDWTNADFAYDIEGKPASQRGKR